jgi:5'-3' exonuclease
MGSGLNGLMYVFPYLISVYSLMSRFQAPGEAEATLAAMTASGIPLRVDAILTDDSDSFVFGASVVLRMCVFTILY